jgi:hypothetical protein
MKDDAKKPDLVVFNEDTQQYDAALKPYGTSASSPAIGIGCVAGTRARPVFPVG